MRQGDGVKRLISRNFYPCGAAWGTHTVRVAERGAGGDERGKKMRRRERKTEGRRSDVGEEKERSDGWGGRGERVEKFARLLFFSCRGRSLLTYPRCRKGDERDGGW